MRSELAALIVKREIMKDLQFSKTRTEIARDLGVDRKALNKMLLVHGIDLPSGPVYLPWQKLIYETFSYPEGIEPSDYEQVEAAKKTD